MIPLVRPFLDRVQILFTLMKDFDLFALECAGINTAEAAEDDDGGGEAAVEAEIIGGGSTAATAKEGIALGELSRKAGWLGLPPGGGEAGAALSQAPHLRAASKCAAAKRLLCGMMPFE